MFAKSRHRRPFGLRVLAVFGAVLLSAAGSASALELTPFAVKANPEINEIVPSAGGDYIAWAQNSVGHPRRYDVFIQRPGQPRIKVNRPGTYGGAGGFSGDNYVYSEWRPDGKGDQIARYSISTGARHLYGGVVNTPNHEYHPTLSGRWLLFTRYNWQHDTTYVILYNTQTRATRLLASGRGSNWVYAGQVNGNYATWGRVRSSSQDVYRYDIESQEVTLIPKSGFIYLYNPSIASDGTVYFSRSGDGCGVAVELVRYPLGGPLEVLEPLPQYIDTGYSYVDDRVDGSRGIYYGTIDCRLPSRRRWDSYRLVDSYTLTTTVSGLYGSGTVSSAPTGIDCGSDCTEVYPRGTTVTLTATPDSGSQVLEWIGAPECQAPTTTCTLTLTSDRAVTVSFGAASP